MLSFLMDPNVWASLATLTALEIVLGIDNIIFIAIVIQRLPKEQQKSARQLGLFLALFMRIALLASLFWLSALTRPLFTIMAHEVSMRDLVLLLGGLFLMVKGVNEVHAEMEGPKNSATEGLPRKANYARIIGQIILLDLVFSLDSVITAIGMANDLPVMIAAIVIAILVMLFAAGTISDFIEKHPTVKMLGLAFLILVGVALVADGMHFHIPRGYLYFAIAFSAGVESLNLVVKKKHSRQQK